MTIEKGDIVVCSVEFVENEYFCDSVATRKKCNASAFFVYHDVIPSITVLR